MPTPNEMELMGDANANPDPLSVTESAPLLGRASSDADSHADSDPININNNTNEAIAEEDGVTDDFVANNETNRGRLYNFLHAQTLPGAIAFDYFISILVISSTLTFVFDTVYGVTGQIHAVLDSFELVSVTIFTVEYGMRVYSAKEHPKYHQAGGRLRYMITFLALVDLMSVLPYWLEILWTGNTAHLVKILRLLRFLRIIRLIRYMHYFTPLPAAWMV
jgi:hypothetical protein